MNGYQRIMAALRGDMPDRVPIMLHNFMMAMREAGYTHAQYRNDPQKIANSFIQAVESYHYDGINVDIDTAVLAGAVGVPVDLPDDEPAGCKGGCMDDLAEVSNLPAPSIGGNERIQVWLESARLLKKYFGDEICIRGNCDQAAFSLASMMRTPQLWMMDVADEDQRENVIRLLDYCTEATCQFIRLMAGTGVHMVSNGDSPAGPEMISPAMYEDLALPFEKKIVAEAHQAGVPYALHICGNATVILEGMARTGADAVELDYKTNIARAFEVCSEKLCFIGNIDPSGVLALGSVKDVETKTAELLGLFGNTPRFILNAGCALPPHTPAENLKAMIRVAREFR